MAVKNDDEHVDNFEKLMAIAEGQGYMPTCQTVDRKPS
jgi:hypothetical protein